MYYICPHPTREILILDFKGILKMKMTIDRGQLISTESDVVFVGLFEGEENSNPSINVINDNLNKALNPLVVDGEISGKSGHSVLIPTLGLLESKRIFFSK